MTKIKLFSVTYVNSGFILNVTTLIVQITGIFKTDESWYCIECCGTIFPFNSLSSNENFLACCTNTDNNITQWKNLKNDHNTGIPYKGQPGARYSKFSFKQYFLCQHEHLTLDLTKIHEKRFFLLIAKVWPLIFIMAVTALLNYE